MNLKLDENTPQRLIQTLGQLGHDIDTVREEGLTGQTDPAVWTATQRASRFFVTQDLDFSDIRVYTPAHTLDCCSSAWPIPAAIALARRITQIFETENVEDWHRCLVVATDRKIRVRRP